MKLFEAIENDMISHLYQLCHEQLGITQMPPFELIDDVPSLSTGNQHSFGMFDGQKILVVTTNRHPIDVLRTLAHEIVHWKQMQDGDVMDGSDGSNVENEANAIAGIIMRKFGQRYPDYFIDCIPGQGTPI